MRTYLFITAVLLSFAIRAQHFAKSDVNDYKILLDKGDASFTKKGDNFINIYYGLSLIRPFYRALAAANSVDVKISGVGPAGLVYEHLVTDEVGLGAELNYASTVVKYRVERDNLNGGRSYYEEKVEVTTYRVAFRAAYHFSKSDKLDAYAFVSAGYRGYNYRYSTSYTTVGSVSFSRPSVLPLGFKPGIGIRYFFSPAIGLNAEFALGTPLMCAGLAFKF
jgi:hypothetical protein